MDPGRSKMPLVQEVHALHMDFEAQVTWVLPY